MCIAQAPQRRDTGEAFGLESRTLPLSHRAPFSLNIFYCHKLQQWGWVTSSRNISFDPPPTYTDQSKHVNMATKHIFNYTKS